MLVEVTVLPVTLALYLKLPQVDVVWAAPAPLQLQAVAVVVAEDPLVEAVAVAKRRQSVSLSLPRPHPTLPLNMAQLLIISLLRWLRRHLHHLRHHHHCPQAVLAEDPTLPLTIITPPKMSHRQIQERIWRMHTMIYMKIDR